MNTCLPRDDGVGRDPKPVFLLRRGDSVTALPEAAVAPITPTLDVHAGARPGVTVDFPDVWGLLPQIYIFNIYNQ